MKEFNTLKMINMCKSFGDLHVLNDFNLEIERGEFVTFLGPSGCGKSTALNCISGLLNISGGRIQVDDEVLDDADKVFVSPEKRGFGIIFQNYALFPHMTVYDNIAFSLTVAHKSKDEIAKRVAEAVRMVHLEGQEKKYPSQLSGGQQQRVAIARSVIMEPRLLLLDEPLSNLDTKLRTEMRYELKQIHTKLERASIYVTHDQSEALALSDKIVILKLGKVQQIGSPHQVFLHPNNKFVADFMGYKNIWTGKIDSIEEVAEGRKFSVFVGNNKFVAVLRSGNSPEVDRKILEAYENGDDILVASRPDDIRYGSSDCNNIKVSVEGLEYLGTSMQITGSLEDGTYVQARVDPNAYIAENSTVDLTISPENLILLPVSKED